MAINQEVIDGMDASAEFAAAQLKNLPKEHIETVSNWWKENYMKAGHKRLAKILLSYKGD